MNWQEWKFEGNTVSPPDRQLEAKEFADHKKVLVNNLGKWQGGKKQHFEFPYEVNSLGDQLRAGETPSMKADLHYFPTTAEAADVMFNSLVTLDPVTVLEPSAGQGALLDLWGEFCPYAKENSEIDCVEMHEGNVNVLKQKEYNVVARDFDNYETDKRYELILANPPFKHGLRHLKKMVSLLKRNGDLGIILPSNFGESKDEKAYLQELDDSQAFESWGERPIPDKAFAKSGTNVSTKVLYFKYRNV